jgi:hypothetical protein
MATGNAVIEDPCMTISLSSFIKGARPIEQSS